MANIKQQKKRILTNEKARFNNKVFKSQVKTAIANAYKAILKKDKDVLQKVILAQKLLDKLVSKKIKQINYSARKKSQLQTKLNALDKNK